MKRPRPTSCLFVVFSFSLAAFLFALSASAQQPLKVLITPFKIHAQQDMSFLNSGIMAMLSSRLGRDGAVDVIFAPVEPGNDAAARAKARELQADYLLTGNLTIFGNAVSTDASFLDIEAGTVAVKFDEYGQNSGDVLAHIDKFADQINAKVLNQPTAMAAPAQAAPVAAAPVIEPEKTPSAAAPAPTAQPEVKTTAVTPPPVVVPPTTTTAAAPPETAVTSAETATASAAKTPPAIWKSQVFNFEIDGLTVADVDGDGQNETVLIGDGDVHVYRLANNALTKVHVFKVANHLHLLTVDAADLNSNGRAEIFVTSLSRRGDAGASTRQGKVDRLGSFVLEWDGNGLKMAADDLRWYFRAADAPGSGRVLYGQKRGIVSAGDFLDTIEGKDSLFVKGVYPLTWRNGSLEEGERLDLPGGVNVFSFTTGNLLNDGRRMLAVETESRYLNVLNPENRVEWESGERYGGSTRYLEYPAMSGREPDRYYLPQRMVVADTNQDGNSELLVVKNEDTARGVIGRVRVFRNGQAEVLAWNGVTMQALWHSDVMAGHVSDLAWADMNNDGQNEVVLVIGPKGGSFEGGRSHIVAYKLK